MFSGRKVQPHLATDHRRINANFLLSPLSVPIAVQPMKVLTNSPDFFRLQLPISIVTCLRACVWMCVCVFVAERETVCVTVWERDWERVCVWVFLCLCVCLCVRQREWESVCKCVFVWVREGLYGVCLCERQREIVCMCVYFVNERVAPSSASFHSFHHFRSPLNFPLLVFPFNLSLNLPFLFFLGFYFSVFFPKNRGS